MTDVQKFLTWLEKQNGYTVRADIVDEKFPDLSFDLVGVTTQRDKDGNTLVPKRDYRQAIKYGQTLD